MNELTVQDLNEMKPGVFKSGVCYNTDLSKDAPVRWVAVRGGINDWAIYFHTADHDEMFVAKHGDKIYSKNIIKSVLACTEEAFDRYRF